MVAPLLLAPQVGIVLARLAQTASTRLAPVAVGALALGLVGDTPEWQPVNIDSEYSTYTTGDNFIWVPASYPDPEVKPIPDPVKSAEGKASKYDDVFDYIAQNKNSLDNTDPITEKVANFILEDLAKEINDIAKENNFSKQDFTKDDLLPALAPLRTDLGRSASRQASGASAPSNPAVAEKQKVEIEKEKLEEQKKTNTALTDTLEEQKEINNTLTDTIPDLALGIGTISTLIAGIKTAVEGIAQKTDIIVKTEVDGVTGKAKCFPVTLCDDVFDNTETLLNKYFPPGWLAFLSAVLPKMLEYWTKQPITKEDVEKFLEDFFQTNNSDPTKNKNIAEIFDQLKINVFAVSDNEGEE